MQLSFYRITSVSARKKTPVPQNYSEKTGAYAGGFGKYYTRMVCAIVMEYLMANRLTKSITTAPLP
jgi:hypothetical protein